MTHDTYWVVFWIACALLSVSIGWWLGLRSGRKRLEAARRRATP